MYTIKNIVQTFSFEEMNEQNEVIEKYFFYQIVIEFSFGQDILFEETLDKVILLTQIPGGESGLNAACLQVAEEEGAAMNLIYEEFFSQNQNLSQMNLAEIKAKAMQAKSKNTNESI